MSVKNFEDPILSIFENSQLPNKKGERMGGRVPTMQTFISLLTDEVFTDKVGCHYFSATIPKCNIRLSISKVAFLIRVDSEILCLYDAFL